MILELRNICKTYNQGKLDVPVLKNVSLSVEEGEFLAIMGPSGSGKTTLMNIIGCLDTPTSGEYILEGEELSEQSDSQLSQVRLHSIGFVFQSFHLLSRQTAVENVALPLLYAGVRKKERIEIAKKSLERVGLADRVNFKPTQLSGGQCQRVAIARAIVNNPKILLADEPTGALDTKSGEQIMELFKKLNSEGVTIVMITHEPEIAAHASRTLHIRDGQLLDSNGNVITQNTEPALPKDIIPTKEFLSEGVKITDEDNANICPKANNVSEKKSACSSSDAIKSDIISNAQKPLHKQTAHEVTPIEIGNPFESAGAASSVQHEREVTSIEISNPFDFSAKSSETEEPNGIDIESIEIDTKTAEEETFEQNDSDSLVKSSETETEDEEERMPFDTASFEFVRDETPTQQNNTAGQFGAPMKTEIDLSNAFGRGVPMPQEPTADQPVGGYKKLVEIDVFGRSAHGEDSQ